MSLINDALKKAQQKRAEEQAARPPAPPATDASAAPRPPSPPRPAPGVPAVRYTIPAVPDFPQPTSTPKPRVSSVRYDPSGGEANTQREDSKASSPQKTFWIALASVAAAAIVVRLAVTLTRNSPETARNQTEQLAPEARPAPPPQATVALPVPNLPPPSLPAATPATEPPPTVTFQPNPPPTAKPPQTPVPATITAVAPQPPAAIPASTTPGQPTEVTFPTTSGTVETSQPKPAPTVLPSIYAPRAPAPVNNATRIQNFIDRLRVTGVRISETGSKVILNDRLFNVGETVDPGLELKLVRIEPGLITFTDAGGKNYVKLYQ